ncbi:DivIVA domain-containing protein [Tersicoccus sp. Bi-70]|uniref:DivIVA domain-containing protein n=1 Tax=Tersicoccus sp. Bi-70 TaxID=1897634 RepID=UPI0009F95DDE|nr:DivIVA domain-containing protein [Tersicoccus sp. Bi-70]
MSATGESGPVTTTAGSPALPESAPAEDADRAPFTLVPHRRRGYRPAQVDAFLDRVREAWRTDTADAPLGSGHVRDAVFDLVRGGYDPQEVDAELDRLEDAFARRERDDAVATGRADLDQALAVVRARLTRGPGQRFRAPTGRRPGYRQRDVDALCERVAEHLDGSTRLRLEDVRAARFSPQRGSDAYDSGQVDLFLDRVIDILRSRG